MVDLSPKTPSQSTVVLSEAVGVVFVALDEEGSPRAVPPVRPETDEERRRMAEAKLRREHRLARRQAILDQRRAGHDAAG